MPSRTARDVLTGEDAVAVREMLDAQPQFVNESPPPVRNLYDWISTLLRLLYRFIVLILNFGNDRIEALEASVAVLQARPTTTSSQPAPSIPRQPQRPSSSTKCQRCHAMGHTVTDCRSLDPAAIKKRVAATQKAAKEMERRRMAALLPRHQLARSSIALPTEDFFGDPILSRSRAHFMDTRSMTALAVDATEYRRRKIQSTRDKRRRAASSTDTTT